MRQENADVPDVYLTLLDAAGISLTLVLNRFDKTKRVFEKEHNEEAKVYEELEEEQEAPIPLITQYILHSMFSIVEVYVYNQRIYNSKGLYAHKSYIYNNFKGAISEYKVVCTATGTIIKIFRMILWKPLGLELFSKGESNCLVDPMASCCMMKWELTFSSLLNCYIQIWKTAYN